MKPKVSVIMAFFNAETYLEEAISSILLQTFKDFEFIIVNDGSTDNSSHILKQYSDDRIKIINNYENKGLPFSLNIAIQQSKGDFLARMDADDISVPTRLEKQYNFLKENPNISIVGSLIKVIDVENNRAYIPTYYKNGEDISSALVFGPHLVHPALMFRKEVFMHAMYNESYRSANDYELYSRLYKEHQFYNIPEILLNYRKHQNQISTAHYAKQQQFSKGIRSLFLNSLDIFPSNTELELHQYISLQIDIPGNYSLNEIERWLLQLVEANNRKFTFSKESFKNVIYDKWKSICEWYIDITSGESWDLFLRSELSKGISLEQELSNFPSIINNLKKMGIINMAIFGSLGVACTLYKNLSGNFFIVSFLDNYANQKKGTLYDVPIVKPNQFLEKSMDNIDCVIMSIKGEHSSLIEEQLRIMCQNKVKILSYQTLKEWASGENI